jgi:hypothetical protein
MLESIRIRSGMIPPDKKLMPKPNPKRRADLKGRLLERAKP